MNETVKKYNSKYTYEEYLTWNDGERWEIIDGEAFCMSPAPTTEHQKVLMEISRQIANFLVGKSCRVFVAPFDVRLFKAENNVDTVVQPDISIICDRNKIDSKGCNGSPSMIIEIVSPSTATMDYIKKLELYEKHFVKEYWIVHPIDKIIMIYKIRDDGKYGKSETYSQEHKVEVGIFNGELVIDLGEVFKD